MNPALSVIFFSTASGAGYGMLFLLGVLAPLGAVPQGRWFGLVAGGVSLALITAGLLSSTAHLGRPERAWRAVSQWRSSWLAREGAAALLTYLPAGLFVLAWVIGGRPGISGDVFGPLAAIGAVATVCCTAMIYASLKPIRQWRQPLVLPGYLIYALFSGAVCLAALGWFWPGRAVVPAAIGVIAGFAAIGVKRAYWRRIDQPAPAGTPTIETATGLGRIGPTRPLDPPHTEENYLMREMGYRIARKHASRLRRIALLGGFALPTLLALLCLLLGSVVHPLAAVFGVVAALAVLGGLFLERWLFFAEATHTVMLYYRRPADSAGSDARVRRAGAG